MLEFLANPDPEIYLGGNYVVIDFEIDTSHGDFGNALWMDNQMLLASYKLGPDHTMGPDHRPRSIWADEYHMQELCEVIDEADFVVAHNAKYEAGWFHRLGVDLRTLLLFDTAIGEYVLMGNLAAGDEKMPPRKLNLEHCCRRRNYPVKDPVVDMLMKDGINPVHMPRAWLQGRCESDVVSTEKVFLDQRGRLSRTNRLGVLLTRCLLTPVLADVERNGVRLNEERVAEEFVKYEEEFARLSQEMDEFTGGINWRSPKQAAKFIYEELGFEELTRFDFRTKQKIPLRTKATKRSPEGNRRTDNKTLAKLQATTERQRKFLELRKRIGKVDTALTKSLRFFNGICREMGGVFYAQFNQTATATHRLSSNGLDTKFELYEGETKKVQFQNLARVFKRLLRAKREGWYIGEWDGSQLEFRVAIEMSKDKQGIEDILSGHDVHKFTGAWIYHAPKEWLNDIAGHIKDSEALMDKVTKEQRQNSKAHTFKPTYGGKSGTPREQAYYSAFQARYSGLSATQQGWVYEVLNSPHKSLQTVWGLRYYWPYARMSKSGWCNVTSSVYNYPIQAFATAEIIPIAIVFFWHRLAERGLTEVIEIVNSVHDSVICEIHPDHVDDFEQLAIDVWFDVYRYLEQVYGFRFEHVPLGTEVVIGDHWSESNIKEQAYNIYVDGKVEKI